MIGLIDNDVLIKGSCYRLLPELVVGVSPLHSIGVLGTARFVVPDRIRKSQLRAEHTQAVELFMSFLSHVSVVEPTADEQQMAADLELAAQRLGLSLDSGESQLCAVLVIRLLSLLMTGDKRAITAIDQLIDHESRLNSVRGKVMCLEQLFLALLNNTSHGIRNSVCAEPDIDKTMSNCFSCAGDVDSKDSQMEGLTSYIESLRTVASRVLRA